MHFRENPNDSDSKRISSTDPPASGDPAGSESSNLGTVMDRQKPVNTRGFDTRVAYGYTRGYYVINRGFTGYPGHPWLYLAQMRSP